MAKLKDSASNQGPVSIILPTEKECQGVVKYGIDRKSPEGEKAVVTNVYVSRKTWGGDMPKKVKITIERAD